MLNEYIDKPLEVGTVLKEDFDGEINLIGFNKEMKENQKN